MLDWGHARCRGRLRRATQEDDVLFQSEKSAPSVAAGRMPMMATPSEVTSDMLLARVLASLDDDKAEEVVTIDLRGKSEMADHMVIASGRSSRQVGAIAEKLVDRLKQDFGRSCKIEGKGQGDWVLIDAGDVVVHLFRPEVRDFYQLEKMWMTSPVTAAAVRPSTAVREG